MVKITVYIINNKYVQKKCCFKIMKKLILSWKNGVPFYIFFSKNSKFVIIGGAMGSTLDF